MRADAFEKPAGHYFLSHSIGLRPLSADKALEDNFTRAWRHGESNAWDVWLASLTRFRERLGVLIGARPDDICPQTNISSGVAKILFALPERRGRRMIVLTEDDFPTIGFVLAQGRRLGYELVFLPIWTPFNPTSPSAPISSISAEDPGRRFYGRKGKRQRKQRPWMSDGSATKNLSKWTSGTFVMHTMPPAFGAGPLRLRLTLRLLRVSKSCSKPESKRSRRIISVFSRVFWSRCRPA